MISLLLLALLGFLEASPVSPRPLSSLACGEIRTYNGQALSVAKSQVRAKVLFLQSVKAHVGDKVQRCQQECCSREKCNVALFDSTRAETAYNCFLMSCQPVQECVFEAANGTTLMLARLKENLSLSSSGPTFLQSHKLRITTKDAIRTTTILPNTTVPQPPTTTTTSSSSSTTTTTTTTTTTPKPTTTIKPSTPQPTTTASAATTTTTITTTKIPTTAPHTTTSSRVRANDTLLKAESGSDENLDPEFVRDTTTTASLVAALCFGLLFLCAVMVLGGKRIYDGWQRRHYNKLDYLMNGTYN